MLAKWLQRSAVLGAALVSVASSARAQPSDAGGAATLEPRAPRAEQLELARLSLSGSYFRGEMLVGHGSVQRYHGVGSTLDIEAMRFFLPRLGIEIAAHVSPNVFAMQSAGEVFGGLAAALDFAPLVWERGSVIVGVGAGFEGGARYWFSELRAYPRALLRGRLLPGPNLGLHAAYELIPVSTGPHWALQNRLELALGWHLLHAGLRAGVTRVQGGEPQRTLVEVEAGTFLGIGVFQ